MVGVMGFYPHLVKTTYRPTTTAKQAVNKPDKKMLNIPPIKVAINPSTQWHNLYAYPQRQVMEAEVCGLIGQKVVDILVNRGVNARLFWDSNPTQYDSEDRYAELITAGKAWGDVFVSFHTDSAGDKRDYTGSLGCYKSNADLQLSTTIQEQMRAEFNWPNAGASYRTDLAALNYAPNIPSVLLEIGNHSDPDDAKLLVEQPDLFARAIANGICKHYSIPYENNTEDEEMISPPVALDSNFQKWQTHVDFKTDPRSLLITVASGEKPGVPEPGLITSVTIYTSQNGNYKPVIAVKLGIGGPTFIWRQAGYVGPVVIDSVPNSITVQWG